MIDRGRAFALTAIAMLAFAGNSLLCRAALKHTAIDPASFTTIRLLSGAVTLWLLVSVGRRGGGGGDGGGGESAGHGSWASALALFVYAAGFSWAYVGLSAASGALLLFGAVQVTMIGHGVWRGERLTPLQLVGMLLAFGGLLYLLLPGLSAPPLREATWMLIAGVAWGIYSLRGRSAGDALRVTAGNFLRAGPIALLLSLVMVGSASLDAAGVGYAVASGALASGVGYAVWYSALPALKATSAATVQLSVPAIAALGGIVFLGEAMTWRLLIASLGILGGVALVIATRPSPQPSPCQGEGASQAANNCRSTNGRMPPWR